MSRRGQLILKVTLAFTLAAASADHRVALLIDNHAHEREELGTPARDFRSLARTLEILGFRCTTLANLQEQDLRKSVEAFASRTPTCGTALIVYSGAVTPGNDKGKSVPVLAGVSSDKGRGYPLSEIFGQLTTRGGSRHNLVLVDSSSETVGDSKIPPGCLLGQVNLLRLVPALQDASDLLAPIRKVSGTLYDTIDPLVSLARQGSRAITPPGRFVEGTKAGDEWVDAKGIVFCWCPPGTYTAGSPPDEPGRYADEEQRKIVIEEGFWISKYEITLSQWGHNLHRNHIATQKLHPAQMVSQSKDSSRVLRPLIELARIQSALPTDWVYRHPTEAEWEYAARAGAKTSFSFGSDPADLVEHANFGDKSWFDSLDIYSLRGHRQWNDGSVRLAPIGSYRPNAWGLHDVHGNVAEWTHESVVRGGSWASEPGSCRLAYRHRLGDRDQREYIGCRFVICREIPKKK